MRMKRLFFIAAIVLCVGSLVFSCKSNSKASSEMEQIVKEINKQCPISAGMMGDITSAQIDGDNVVFTFSCEEDFINIESLQQNQASVKYGIIQTFATMKDGNVQFLMNELEKAGMGITYKLVGKDSGKQLEVSVSADEIKNVKQGNAGDGDPDALLETNIKLTNAQCPMSLGQGLVMTQVIREGDNVVYIYDADEDVVSIDALKTSEDMVLEMLRNELKNSSSDPSMAGFLKICRSAGVGIAYRYVGTKTGKSATFFIGADEI